MSENGGNGGSLWGGGSPWGGGYQSLDRKIDAVERDFRAEIGAIRVEMRQGNETILDRIDRASTAAAANAAKPTNPLQLIGTAVGIIALLGSWFGYVSNNLSENINSNKVAIAEELKSRVDAQRLIYEKLWSKDAQVEMEKRIDERDQFERTASKEQADRITHNVETIVAHMVPREEHDQHWIEDKAYKERSERAIDASINRLAEHLNKSDETTAAKFNEEEKVLHAVGISDELKNLESHQRDMDEKIFRLSTPFDAKGSSTKP